MRGIHSSVPSCPPFHLWVFGQSTSLGMLLAPTTQCQSLAAPAGSPASKNGNNPQLLAPLPNNILGFGPNVQSAIKFVMFNLQLKRQICLQKSLMQFFPCVHCNIPYIHACCQMTTKKQCLIGFNLLTYQVGS